MTDEAAGSTADTVARLWRRIEAALQAHDSPMLRTLAPGASEEAIAELEATIGVTLPEDFRASYRIHDGGFSVELVSQMTTESLEGVVEYWQMFEELRRDASWVGQSPFGLACAPIQPVWFHPGWVPFAIDVTGNFACLDMAPTADGMVGQIIDWDHEAGPTRVLFPNFTALLTALAEQVETGSQPDE